MARAAGHAGAQTLLFLIAFLSLLPDAVSHREMLHKRGHESHPAHVCGDRQGPASPLLFSVSASLQGNSFIKQGPVVPFSSLTPDPRSVS